MNKSDFDPSVTRWFRCEDPCSVIAAASSKQLAKWLEAIDPVEVICLSFSQESGHLNLLVQTVEAYGQCVTKIDALPEAVKSFTMSVNNGSIFQSCATRDDEIISCPPRKIVN